MFESTWRENVLYDNQRDTGFSIVPDEKYSGMWRVRYPDGTLSDMVNRVRAKDAARALARAALDRLRNEAVRHTGAAQER